MNSMERLNFVLRLAEMSLDSLSEGRKMLLREEMIEFLDWPPSSDAAHWLQRVLTLLHISEMQEDVRYVLYELASGLEWFKKGGVHDLQTWMKAPRQLPEGLRVRSAVDAETGKPLRHHLVVSMQGDLDLDFLEPSSLQAQLINSRDVRTAFRIKLASVLAAVGVLALRICPACNRVFVAEHGKRQFCSDRCKAREMMRRYRQSHREKLNDKAHEHYRQKVEPKSKGKVQRRKRTTKQRREV